MTAGGPLDQPVLVVSEGFDWLARRLVRQPREEQVFEVWDGEGREVARVEPTDRDGAASKVLRLLLAMVLTSSSRRNVRGLRVADLAGTTLLGLQIKGDRLVVSGAGGEPVGVVRNTSPPGRLEATFYVDGVQVATMADRVDRPPYEYELRTAAGAPFARGSNSGNRRNVLEILDRSDPRLATLAAGFVCGMVDRVWLMARQVGSGGEG